MEKHHTPLLKYLLFLFLPLPLPVAVSSTSPRRTHAAAPQKPTCSWGHLRASHQAGRSSTFRQSSPGRMLPWCQPSLRTMLRVCFGHAPSTHDELQKPPGTVSALPNPTAQRACEKQNANSAMVLGQRELLKLHSSVTTFTPNQAFKEKSSCTKTMFSPRTTQVGHIPPQKVHLHLTRLLTFLIYCCDDAVDDLVCSTAAGGSTAAATPHTHSGEQQGGLVRRASTVPWPAAQCAGSPGLALGGTYLPLMAQVLETGQGRTEAQGPLYTLPGRAIRG